MVLLWFGIRLLALLIGALVFLSLTLFSIRRTILASVFLLIALPAPTYAYPFLPISINNKITLGLVVFVLFYGALGILLRGKLRLRKHPMDIPVLLFLLVTAVGACLGFLTGNKIRFVVQETFVFSLFLFYFVATSLFDTALVKRLVAVIVLASLAASVQYILGFAMSAAAVGPGRVVSRQVNIFLVSVPFLVSFLFFDPSRRRKLVYFVLLLVMMVGILLSQTRGIWIALILQVACLLLLYRKRLGPKAIPFLVTFVMIVLISMCGIFFFFQRTTGLNVLSLLSRRALTVRHMFLDPAMMERVVANRAVLQEIKHVPLLGSGLGSTISYVFFGHRSVVNWIDNAYTVLLWKVGLLGFAIFVWMLIAALRQAVKLYRSPPTEFHWVFSSVVIALIVGLAASSLAAAVLVKYRFNMVWALLIGGLAVLSEEGSGGL